MRAGANTNGSFGLNYGAKFNSGSFDLLYPVFVKIAEPAPFSNVVGTPFTRGTSFKVPGYDAPAYQEFLNGQRMVAKLTTHSPTLQAYVDLDAHMVSKAVGLPLVGNVAGIGYNLMSINAGVGLDVAQTISIGLRPINDSGPVNVGRLSLPLYQNSFSFAMGAVSGLPFNITQALPDSVSANPGYRALFALGNQHESGLESGQIRTLGLGCALVLSCRSVFYANADPSTLNQYGERVFMQHSDALRLATNNPGEVGTDASQLAQLYATGYSPDHIELVSPIGLPSPVPEPASWAMLLLGFASLGLARRAVSPPATSPRPSRQS